MLKSLVRVALLSAASLMLIGSASALYVNNDPMNATDPTGEQLQCATPATAGPCAGAGAAGVAVGTIVVGAAVIVDSQNRRFNRPHAPVWSDPLQHAADNHGESTTPDGRPIRDHGRQGSGSDYLTGKGHTPDQVDDIINNPSDSYPTAKGDHRKGEPATAHVDDDGNFVVINDKTGEIIQVNDRNNPKQQPPDRKPDEK